MLTEKEIKKLNDLENIIDIQFKDKELLKHSLIHRSYVNEILDQKIESNERIEFLGDAVLEIIITEYLFFKYPKRPEGELTSFRAATVNTKSLAKTAQQIDLGKYIYMSKGEKLTGGEERPYILANTFEALLGAIYLDQGFSTAKKFIERVLIPKIENIVDNRLDIDSKSRLQETAQAKLGITPTYKLIEATGPDHNKNFVMSVIIGKHVFGTGEGGNKQEAEENAAEDALKNWDKNYQKYFSIA